MAWGLLSYFLRAGLGRTPHLLEPAASRLKGLPHCITEQTTTDLSVDSMKSCFEVDKYPVFAYLTLLSLGGKIIPL